MAPEIVNPVPLDDVEPWLRQLVSSLLGNPYDADFARRAEWRRRSWLPDRTWAARDHGRLVATLATQPRTLTIPGPGTSTRELEVDALTGVTVSATHRRRGLLSDMIGRSLAAAKDRGDLLSMLVAAEWPIYGRFGYAPATRSTECRLLSRRPGAVVDGADTTTVRQIETDEAGPIADAVFERARRRRAGQVDRRATWWDRQLGLDGYERLGDNHPHWFVHEGPDGPDGVLAWQVTRDFDFLRLGALEVSQFVAATDAAERDLWGYLCGIDAVEELEVHPLPVDTAAHFLLRDGRALQQQQVVDFLWVRLLDVPRALAARSYAADGDVVLDVLDPTVGGYGAGRIRLTVSDGEVGCAPTSDEPDIVLDARTLASLYLGGFSLRALSGVQQVDELSAGTIERLSIMFSTPLAPFTQTGF